MKFPELVQLGWAQAIRIAEVIFIKIMRQWQTRRFHALQQLLFLSTSDLGFKDSQLEVVIAGRFFLGLQQDLRNIGHKTTQAESLCTGSDGRNFIYDLFHAS